MANEIGVAFTTGNNVYAQIRNTVNEIWNTVGAAFEAYATANIGDYDIPLTEQGTASGYYVGSFPITDAGAFSIEAFKRVGGAPAESDPVIGALSRFAWNGADSLYERVDIRAISGNTDRADDLRQMMSDYAGNTNILPVQLINGVEHGGATASFLFGHGGQILAESGTNNHGLSIVGDGSGHGMILIGGATSGEGLRITSSNSNALHCIGGGANHGAFFAGGFGGGNGIHATGASSAHGINALGGVGGSGIRAVGSGAGHGLHCAGGNGSGASGINLVSNSASGAGLQSIASAGAGVLLQGAANNSGLTISVGGGNASGLSISGSGTGHGISFIGGSSGSGIRTSGQGSGHGIHITGGSGVQGHGILCTTTSVGGKGIQITSSSDSGISVIGGVNVPAISIIGQGTGSALGLTAGLDGVAFNTSVSGTGTHFSTGAIAEIQNGLLTLASGDVDGFTLEETLKLCLSALAGKLSGAGTTTVTIRAADDSKDRITATVDADGNRTAITLDAAG